MKASGRVAVLAAVAAAAAAATAGAFVGRLAGAESSLPAELPFYDGRDFTPRWQPVTHAVGSFRLLAQTGQAVRETDLDGRIHVASFVFARCPNLCPLLMERLRRVQEAARAWPDVVLVSYSVTPRLDTPAALAEYGRTHGIDPSRWLLLTGEEAVIDRLARRSYFADDERVGETGIGGRRILHTEKVLLVDGQRRLRGVYDGTQRFEIEHLLEDIRRLRR
jgi:protein SCO1/2